MDIHCQYVKNVILHDVLVSRSGINKIIWCKESGGSLFYKETGKNAECKKCRCQAPGKFFNKIY